MWVAATAVPVCRQGGVTTEAHVFWLLHYLGPTPPRQLLQSVWFATFALYYTHFPLCQYLSFPDPGDEERGDMDPNKTTAKALGLFLFCTDVSFLVTAMH